MPWSPTDRLFAACVRTVLFSLAIASLAYLMIRFIAPVNASKTLDPQYPIQFALWIAGGIGGVVALVVAYRRQKVTEASIFVERFGAAAAQLGAVDPAVRLAGVYAMAGVADEGTPSQRQQCVDVLCGYLRLPYSAASDSMGTTQQVVKKPGLTPHSPSTETTITYRLHDKEVRAAIVLTLEQHLDHYRDPRSSWSSCSIDISGAVLGKVNFANCHFDGLITARGTTFTGWASFGRATFAKWASFNGATFTEWADFNGARFTERADFDGATFTEWADFNGATFSGGVPFPTGAANFDGATFAKKARFDGATFTGSAEFNGVRFTGSADFNGVRFTGRADFNGATFTGVTLFEGSTFSSKKTISSSFEHVGYGSRDVSFRGADFGAGEVNFSRPRAWDPGPRFDWDENPSLKPSNVLPVKWPPTVVGQE